MSAHVHIIGRAAGAVSSDAAAFYRDYWQVAGTVASASDDKRLALVRQLFAERPVGQRLLEIGVGGEGGMLRVLRDGNEVAGLDVSSSAIDCCRQWDVPVSPCHVGAEPIPFPDDHFDVVFAFEVCEHFANPQFAIEEIRRVLRPGGRFIASTPNPYIHHWPRYFYPSLVERESFREFLLVNQFAIRREIALEAHRYERLLAPEHAGWSWLWDCQGAKGDAAALVAAAHHFWARSDAHGIRLRPMEVADLARAALALASDTVEARGLLAAASVYRLLVGETGDCEAQLHALTEVCATPGAADAEAARFWVATVEIELRRFGLSVIDDRTLDGLETLVAAADPGRGAALAEARATAARLAPVATVPPAQ